jgi:heat shock protein HtpX
MYTAIAANKRKTFFLIVGFILFVTAIAYLFGEVIGQPSIFYFVAVGSLVYSFVSYLFSDKIALGMSGAKPIQKKDAPELYRVVENLSIAAGLSMPRVYIINDASPNAFATGRDPKHAAVAVTSGLLERLEKDELEGVIAHELGHVGNYDIRLTSIVAALVSVISLVSDLLLHISFWGGDDEDSSFGPFGFILGLLISILAPIIAVMIQLAISRRREYLADASGALLTRYPDGLANALRKISSAEPMSRPSTATAHLFIANPFGNQGMVQKLFSTHPPIVDRIKRLQEMDGHV